LPIDVERPFKYGHDQGGSVYFDPASPNLPGPIRLLNAHAIGISSSGVNIELGGQGEHYGFESVFSDPATDSTRMVWKDVFPSTRPIPELFFYAESGIVKR